MENKSKVLVGIGLVGVGLLVAMIAFTGGDVSLLKPSNNASSTDNADNSIESQQPTTPSPLKSSDSAAGSSQMGIRRVVYTNAGFSPFLVELSAGESVEFVNRSSTGLWVTTKQHPTLGDQKYEAFDTGRTLKQGETFVFSFTQVGTWGYKNLNNDVHLGAVVVTPQR